jgi:hypothetical protein
MVAKTVYDNFSNRNLSGHSMHGLMTIRELLSLLWVPGWSNTIAGALIASTSTNHSFLSRCAVFKMRLVAQIFFSAFCAADVLAAVGMFDVTMVTGSASVGVTTAYSPSPLNLSSHSGCPLLPLHIHQRYLCASED